MPLVCLALVACRPSPASSHLDAGLDADALPDGANPGEPFVPSWPEHRVGAFYVQGFSGPALTAIELLRERNAAVYTVEHIIRTPGLFLRDIYSVHNVFDVAVGFFFQEEPEDGYYCLYEHPDDGSPRPTFGATEIRDCANVRQTLRRHADQLIAAGIDHVIADATNLARLDDYSRLIQLRPLEILLKYWHEYRMEGFPTPDVAVWTSTFDPINELPADIHHEFLALYNHDDYESLILRDAATGKKIMFIVDRIGMPAHAGVVEEIRDNGGQDDIIAVMAWGDRADTPPQLQTQFSFIQPCLTASGRQTTTLLDERVCNQPYLPEAQSAIGSQVVASVSYQLRHASVALSASGRLGGYTLRRTMERAFEVKPKWLWITGWNEHNAQPQPPTPPWSDFGMGSVGLEDDRLQGEYDGTYYFTDTYGAEFNRSFEPTKESGDHLYRMVESCLRVYRRVLNDQPGCDSGSSELCCTVENPLRLVFSLKTVSDGDYLLTASASERDGLVATAQWRQICHPDVGPEDACVNAQESLRFSGPFLVYKDDGAHRAILYRCRRSDNSLHFFSTDSACEGHVTEGALGYISTRRTSEAARPLRRCLRQGMRFHRLERGCPSDSTLDSADPMGYVR